VVEKLEPWRKEKRHRDGSIKEINGLIYARVQYRDDVTGKRKEKLRRAKNRKQANELIKQMRAELEQSGQLALESDQITFRQLAKKYESLKLVPATYQNGIKVSGRRSLGPAVSALNNLIAGFGDKKVRSIRPSDVESYKLKRLSEPVKILVNLSTEKGQTDRASLKKRWVFRPRKIASVNRELELLRAVLNFAKGEGLINTSPFENGTKLISNAAEVMRERILSREEEVRLIAECVSRRDHLRPLIIVAVDTALRRGELFKLRWSDVDLIEGHITVRAENAKTERMRVVGITQRMNVELTQLWNRSAQTQDELVFGIVSTIKNGWKSLCQAADITDLRFHDLRHTATTRLIRAGVPVSEVMKITGHTQMSTFLRYLNQTHESVSESAKSLDRYLSA
jgi:integrase